MIFKNTKEFQDALAYVKALQESQQAYVKDSLTRAIQEVKNAKFEGRSLQTIDDFIKEMREELVIIGKNNVATSRPKYYISPKVKALEMGFKNPDDLSFDYKKEQTEILEEKYL